MSLDHNPSNAESPEKGADTYFWPVLILIVGILISAIYQIVMMESQMDSLLQASVQMEPKIRQAEYEKAKLYKLASDVLQLAATDPIAKQIVTDYKIEHRAPMEPTGADSSGPPGLPTR